MKRIIDASPIAISAYTGDDSYTFTKMATKEEPKKNNSTNNEPENLDTKDIGQLRALRDYYLTKAGEIDRKIEKITKKEFDRKKSVVKQTHIKGHPIMYFDEDNIPVINLNGNLVRVK